MPVNTTLPQISYTANGVTNTFAYPFRILANADMAVYYNGVKQTSGYTVTGINNSTGGTVVATAIPTNGTIILLRRETTIERQTDYVEGGSLTAASLDDDFDRIVMQVQNLDSVAFKLDSNLNLDAGSRRVVNVLDPVNAQDAVTKNWAETTGSSFVSQSGTNATNAAASAASALANKNSTDTNVTTCTTKASEAAASAAAALANKNTTDTNVTTTNNNVTTTNNNVATTNTNVTTCTTKASEAAASAAAALASETSAASILDSFDDRYLGSKAADPTVDNDGNPLQVGALYWNTTDNIMKARSSSGTWINATVNAQPANTTLNAIANASMGPFALRNKIINGNFDIWQRGTSQTTSGYGSADRWSSTNGGTTKTHSRQTFTLGQTDVPGEPTYFSRTVVTSAAGTGNYCALGQFIESVRTFAGKNATITFWAKADTSKNIALEFMQDFGTGGTPSARVNSIASQLIPLTTVWQKFTRTVAIPSISGKTLGTDNNDWFGIHFWLEAGSDFNARTASLGQQSGTFDIAQVQIEEGSVATPFEQRPIGYELSLCQRYFEKLLSSQRVYAGAATTYHDITLKMVEKRAIPTVTLGTPRVSLNVTSNTVEATDMTTNSARLFLLATAVGDAYTIGLPISFSAEL